MHIIQPDGLCVTSKITVDLIRLYQNIQALVTHGKYSKVPHLRVCAFKLKANF